MTASVLRLADLTTAAHTLESMLRGYGLQVRWLPSGAAIPGSYWGAPEAGLIEDRLYLRPDTPLHSALHEACHWICAGRERRAGLHTDAGGDDVEECAVCYLQVLLAGRLPGVSRQRMFDDMDAWGYSFRLGCARAWFECDAEDARSWLQGHSLPAGAPDQTPGPFVAAPSDPERLTQSAVARAETRRRTLNDD